ncbi:MAG: glycoside hydrolase family 88 protein [Verrucomicrobiota bacterium]|nr:glycoside hydrolase family 88 protein [Verrucomicrobiota bacterium]
MNRNLPPLYRAMTKAAAWPLALALLFVMSSRQAAKADPAPTAGAIQGQRDASGGMSDAEIRDVIERVARAQMRPLADGEYPAVTNLDEARSAKRPEGIAWNYPQGVMLYGMERSTDATGDTNADDFVLRHTAICAGYYHWLAGLERQFGGAGKNFARRTKIRGLIGLGNLDSCGAMGTAMIVCMTRHPEAVTADEREAVARIADWVAHRQARLPDGTLWRAKEYGGTVWPDDLYMGAVFLAHYGLYTGDSEYIDDAASNIIHQAALEQDRDGLWFHGWFETNRTHGSFKWGRGNGWVTVALVETLSAMSKNDPLRPRLLDILRKQINGLKKVQAPDGMWRQVLDKPQLWEETSCTAMFAYGIARAANRGWIDGANMAAARRAFAGIAKRVSADGAVRGTCSGTNIGTTLKFYEDRPHPGDDPHGHGPVLLAGTEILMSKR